MKNRTTINSRRHRFALLAERLEPHGDTTHGARRLRWQQGRWDEILSEGYDDWQRRHLRRRAVRRRTLAAVCVAVALVSNLTVVATVSKLDSMVSVGSAREGRMSAEVALKMINGQ